MKLENENKNKNENNPFSILVNNDDKKKDNNENNENKERPSLFGNILSKNEKKESLFSNINNTKSLFGIPINEKEKEKNIFSINDKKETIEQSNPVSNSIFTIPLISKDNNINNNKDKTLSLFGNNSGKVLFDNNENKSNNIAPILFSNISNTKNSFLEIKGEAFAKSLFDNKNENKQGDNSEKKGTLFDGDDDLEKSDEQDKPKTNYVAEPLKAQDYSQYSKLFNLSINNLFLYNKSDKKYVSKGSGFFSIEKTKDDKSEKPKVVTVFRNHAGNKLVEGFLDNKFNKFDILTKDFDYVVCFGIFIMNDGKPDIAFIKIPFKSEDTAKELKTAYEKAMEIIGKDK